MVRRPPARPGEGGSRGGRVLVKLVEQLLAGCWFKGRILAGLHFKDFRFQSVSGPAGEFSYMAGKLVEFPRLLVGLKVEVLFGKGFEHLACVGHFLIELRQEEVANRHWKLQPQ
jgi:hypothetical protein